MTGIDDGVVNPSGEVAVADCPRNALAEQGEAWIDSLQRVASGAEPLPACSRGGWVTSATPRSPTPIRKRPQRSCHEGPAGVSCCRSGRDRSRDQDVSRRARSSSVHSAVRPWVAQNMDQVRRGPVGRGGRAQ